MKIKSFLLVMLSLAFVTATFAQDNDDESSENTHKKEAKACCKKMPMGCSILTLAPLQISDNGIGFSIGYEHALDKAGIVSINLPILSTFSSTITNEMDPVTSINNNSNGYNDNVHNDAMFYFSPGLKIYPTGMYGKVRYAVGPSIVIGVGQQTKSDYNYNYYSYNGTYGYTTYDKMMMGVMISNSLNINPTSHLYMGLDLGLGFTYFNRLNQQEQGMAMIHQFAFKLGFRF